MTWLMMIKKKLQWIGLLGENLNRKAMVFFYHQIGAFRLKFSHRPIL